MCFSNSWTQVRWSQQHYLYISRKASFSKLLRRPFSLLGQLSLKCLWCSSTLLEYKWCVIITVVYKAALLQLYPQESSRIYHPLPCEYLTYTDPALAAMLLYFLSSALWGSVWITIFIIYTWQIIYKYNIIFNLYTWINIFNLSDIKIINITINYCLYFKIVLCIFVKSNFKNISH